MKPLRLPLLPTLLPQLEGIPYAHLLWRWLWLIVLCAFLGGLSALLVSLNTTPIYEATSKLLINEARSPADVNYNDLLASERSARTYADLMTRDSSLVETFTRLGLDPATIEDQITDLRVTPVRDTQLVELAVEGPSPALLAAVANSLPQVFVEELRNVQTARFADSKASLSTQLDTLRRQIEETQLAMSSLNEARTAQEELEQARLSNLLSQYQASYSDILQNYETLRLAEAQSLDNIVVMEPAQTPDEPIRPRTLVNSLLAAVVGMMLAVGTVFAVEYLDDRVQTPDDPSASPTCRCWARSPTPRTTSRISTARTSCSACRRRAIRRSRPTGGCAPTCSSLMSTSPCAR
jgi:non-specific protein-tyrosine kinase